MKYEVPAYFVIDADSEEEAYATAKEFVKGVIRWTVLGAGEGFYLERCAEVKPHVED